MNKLMIALAFCLVCLSQAFAAEMTMNIERVFMHEPGDYSVMYTRPDKVVVTELPGRSPGKFGDWLNENHLGWGTRGCYPTTLIADVPEDKPMYLKASSGVRRWEVSIEIHIHSVSDVGGGDWKKVSHKSVKHYQTRVVE